MTNFSGLRMDRPGYANALSLGATWQQIQDDWYRRLGLETPISGDDLARIRAARKGKWVA